MSNTRTMTVFFYIPHKFQNRLSF